MESKQENESYDPFVDLGRDELSKIASKALAESAILKQKAAKPKVAFFKSAHFLTFMSAITVALIGLWGTGFIDNSKRLLEQSKEELAADVSQLKKERDRLTIINSGLEEENSSLGNDLRAKTAFFEAAEAITRLDGSLVAWADKSTKLEYIVGFAGPLQSVAKIDIALIDDYRPLPTGNAKLDDVLAKLVDIPNLKQVSIDSDAYYVTRAGLSHLETIETLEALNCTGADFDDQSMATISRMKNLKNLYVESESVGDRGLQHLTKLNQLQTLAIISDAVTDEGISRIVGIRSLKSITVISRNVGNIAIQSLARLPAVERIALSGNFQSADLAPLGRCSQLTALSLDALENTNLRWLSGLDKLQRLYLRFRGRPKLDLRNLSKHKELEVLGIQSAIIENLDDISSFPVLSALDLTNSVFPGKPLDIPRLPPGMKVLILTNTSIGNEDLAGLRTRPLPQLSELDIAFTDIDDNALQQLSTLPKLRFLNIAGSRVTSAGIKNFKSQNLRVAVAGEGRMVGQNELDF